MTIRKLIELLQSHGDDGTADVELSFPDGNGDSCQGVVTSVRVELNSEGNLTSIILETE